VIFFKRFWSIVRPYVLAILTGYALGRVDVARLNFGILTLKPFVAGLPSMRLMAPNGEEI
jgi:hypothetical protein